MAEGYQPKVYRRQGGDEIVVESGGTITVKSGGTVSIESGATLANAGTEAHTGTQTFDDIVGNDATLDINGKAAADATSNGGAVAISGAAGGATSGNGGSVIVTPGALGGTGKAGVIIDRGVKLVNQGAPAAKTVSATLTAAEVLTGIITVNQAAAGASALQLPAASAMDTALPDSAAGDAFDLSVINTSTVDAEDASLTTNTGWTLVGSMDIPAYSAAGSLNASGRFRARKTGTAAWVLYRLA
jgi:hypothetical protein